MHRESFPVNGVFCAQPRKFSPSKVLPYTVYTYVVYVVTKKLLLQRYTCNNLQGVLPTVIGFVTQSQENTL